MASPRRGSVKVVFIDTQYVKADPTSFKSVVQSLTGKDSCVACIENSSVAGIGNDISTSITTSHETMSKREMREDHHDISRSSSTNNVGRDSSIMFSKGMSFKDLDGIFLEMPPLEDLQYWLSQD